MILNDILVEDGNVRGCLEVYSKDGLFIYIYIELLISISNGQPSFSPKYSYRLYYGCDTDETIRKNRVIEGKTNSVYKGITFEYDEFLGKGVEEEGSLKGSSDSVEDVIVFFVECIKEYALVQ